MAETIADLAGTREELAAAMQRRAALRAAANAIQGGEDEAAAAAEVQRAEAGLRAFMFEAAVQGRPEAEERAERHRLGEVVRQARERVGTARRLAREREQANQAVGPTDAKVTALRLRLVVEEGLRLGALYRAHAIASLRAQQAVTALADWMAVHGDAGPESVALREAVMLLPPPSSVHPWRFDQAKRALDADLAAFTAAWGGLPNQLLWDAAAAGPEPTDAPDGSTLTRPGEAA